METVIVKIDEKNIDSIESVGALEHAGEILRKGGLVAFPTETVYGLGGDALDPEASKKIYSAKGRPSDNPLIVHVADKADVDGIVVDIPEKGKKLMDIFWPGPLTLIFRKNDRVPYETTGGLDTVAVRNPSNKVARELFRHCNGYVAAPSANLSGHPSPTTAEHVNNDLNGLVDMIIDGGASDCGLESTIVDVTVDPPMILRPGFVTKEMLEEAVGEVVIDKAIIDPDSNIRPKAPGMKYRHYAPRAELVIVEGELEKVRKKITEQVVNDIAFGKKVGVILMDDEITGREWADDLLTKNIDSSKTVFGLDTGDDDSSVIRIAYIGKKENVSVVAAKLYSVLRDYDKIDIDRIYSEAVDDVGVGAAVMNRLIKAAGHQIIRV